MVSVGDAYAKAKRGRMKLRASFDLFHYWNALRGSRRAPDRREINLASIKHILPDLFILERDQDFVPRFRLAGTRLCTAFGDELRGVAFEKLWADRNAVQAVRFADRSFEDFDPIGARITGTSDSEREQAFEMLMLPLQSEQPRLLGMMCAELRPYWLGLDPVRKFRIEAIRTLDATDLPSPIGQRSPVQAPPLQPRDGEFAPIKPRLSRGRRRGHLVVYDGGRDE